MSKSLAERMEIQQWGDVGVMLLDGKPYAYSTALPDNIHLDILNDILQDIIREVEGRQ